MKNTLTENEQELIEIIRTAHDPAAALVTAFEIIAEEIKRLNIAG